VVLLFPIWFLWARRFTRIYSSGGKEAVKKLGSERELQQWWRRKKKGAGKQ
jgi:hypothetical protein